MLLLLKNNGRRSRLLWLILLAIVLAGPQWIQAQVGEYQVKAAYIEKFSRFLEWPATSEIADSSKAFVICILGDSPIAESLSKLYKRNRIRNKQVTVRQVSALPDSGDCHLLYIGRNTGVTVHEIITKAVQRDMVTISDRKGFSEAGVMINFFVENNKVLFEINYDAVRNSNIHVSYLLLKLARITGKSSNVFQ